MKIQHGYKKLVYCSAISLAFVVMYFFEKDVTLRMAIIQGIITVAGILIVGNVGEHFSKRGQ